MARLDAEVLSLCKVVEGMDEDTEIYLVSPCHGTFFHRCRWVFSAVSPSRFRVASMRRTQSKEKSARNSALKNHLRQRLGLGMRDTKRHSLHTQLLRNFCRLARNRQRWPPACLPHHFQIHPFHAAPPARSQCLHRRLFRRKTPRIPLILILELLAIFSFSRRIN